MKLGGAMAQAMETWLNCKESGYGENQKFAWVATLRDAPAVFVGSGNSFRKIGYVGRPNQLRDHISQRLEPIRKLLDSLKSIGNNFCRQEILVEILMQVVGR